MGSADSLAAAAKAVDIMDTAGRIAADPARRASGARLHEVLALAWAAEGLNAIVIEAELLVRALELPITGNDSQDATRHHAIYSQIAVLKRQFAALRGESPAPRKGVDPDGCNHD